MAKTRPVVTEVDGIASPSRRQAVQVPQNLVPWVEWVMRGEDGNPYDLTLLGFPDSSSSSSSGSASSDNGSRIVLRVIECLSYTSQQIVPIEIEGEVLEARNGLVRARLTSVCTELPGVYILEWSAYSAENELSLIDQGSMIVNRGLSGDRRYAGAPSVSDIRTHMRDSGPEDNYLIDSVEFDLAELAACIERPVQLWNNILEFVPRKYNTTTFPFREQWLNAIIGYLHLLAAVNYDRNLQAYSAGGTSMQDKNKGPVYTQKGMALIAEYKDWVKQRKGQINLEQAFGSTSESF